MSSSFEAAADRGSAATCRVFRPPRWRRPLIDGAARWRRGRLRHRQWSAPRCSISRSVNWASTAAVDGHPRSPQPEAVHRDEDRAGAARCPVGGESGPLLEIRDRAVARHVAAMAPAGRGSAQEGHLGTGSFERASLSFIDPAAVAKLRRRRRTPRNGMAGTMLPPCARAGCPQVRRRALLLRGRTASFSESRAEPAVAREPRVHRREDCAKNAPISGVPPYAPGRRTAEPLFSSSTTQCEFVPGDFTTALFAEHVLEKEPGGKVIYGRPRVVGRCRRRSRRAGGGAR